MVEIKPVYRTYHDALAHLIQQGVIHLGWLNSGLVLPDDCDFKKVYCNKSGSSCLYVDVKERVAYSVDMGD